MKGKLRRLGFSSRRKIDVTLEGWVIDGGFHSVWVFHALPYVTHALKVRNPNKFVNTADAYEAAESLVCELSDNYLYHNVGVSLVTKA